MNLYKSTKEKWGEELQCALDREEFCLLYQPKLNLQTGRLSGVEALIRWDHPEQGIISPLEFIPAAEETRMILPIGEWVLRTACLQNKAWQEQGLSPMIMGVNLSASQLYQGDLAEKVQYILDECGLSPEYLELEITESMTMDVDYVLPILHKLKQIGVRISLDDFGTGYSSLYHLKEFPIDIIKIDRSFVRNCTVDAKDATIVKTIIAMAHQLKLEVIAEGVESKDHLVFLQQNLCNEAQGYLFSKPVSPEVFTKSIPDLERIIPDEGISLEKSNETWLQNDAEATYKDLHEAVRKQRGMIFKYKKENDRFVHSFCEGELIYRLQFTPDQLIGKELKDFLPINEVERKMDFYDRAWNGEENVIYNSNVNGLSYVTSLRPIIRGGKVVEVVGCSVDTTTRKSMAFGSDDLKYRMIADNVQDLICIINSEAIILYASPSHQKLLGITPETLIGESAFKWIHSDDEELIQKQIHQIVTLKTARQVKFRFTCADGWLPVEAIGTPVLDEQEEVEYIVVVCRNAS
ncbi:EAL domain-containing protein [Terribacillus saccharophilus]|uniref:EAL domain-containing protein n=1 Tax=Terribacillus saccharophilus TaxID=361277 RepID=UPI0039826FFA